jgi:predicted enzyme involved in methoxymalonyl-ACP biosynthesis
LVACPESSSKDEFQDRQQDRTNHIPFTRAAFERLAESIACQLAPILSAGDPNAGIAAASVGSPELANFLSGLRVQVNLARATASESADVGRILRTAASFSLAGEKPTLADAEADAIVASQECWLVRVADRLSNFGASGVVIAQAEDSALVIESFSLSCPVLGKQVEYALFCALKGIASARNLRTLAFQYQESGRNQPTLVFLKSVAYETNRQRYELPVEEVEARVEKAAVAPGAWSMTTD